MQTIEALKLLHVVETRATEDESEMVATTKFHFIVAMQRYTELGETDLDDVEAMLIMFPHLQIAYIEQTEGTDEPRYFSCLIDGGCPAIPGSKYRQPRFRIELPGNPILGDGKSDNQNHALVFCRGEFIQLIDANQDQYFEEALKVRSILAEFQTTPTSDPVAIVGAREHIFSEGVGVLGDVAAGKEYTFGTITQRVAAKLGTRQHYGHPDILNSIFMLTRGGTFQYQTIDIRCKQSAKKFAFK
jgi:1,3-beta-glucan synthase